ncbi:MAG TPA: FAD-dependent oxidoreductase [Stellaceae bacterium]|nr:FAD-dependent oxidoreductase [Stellaceae bacterium]
MSTPSAAGAYDVVILGAGYAGLMAALRLRRRTSRLRVGLINRQDAFLERVRVQEAIVRPVASRIPSLGRFLAGTGIDFICGSVTALDPQRRCIRIATTAGERDIVFQQAIYALGSTIDVEAIPGIAEHAYRLDDGEDANAVASLRARLGDAAGQALRIVTIGGAETGIEVAGEIKSACPNAEVTMVSRSRCGEFRGERVAEAVRTALTRLGVHMMDNEPIAEIRPTDIVTASGRTIACDLCIWSGGLRAPSLAAEAGLAIDPQGRIWVDPSLRSVSHPHILAVGDAAHPVAPTGAPYRLSAYGALVSGAYAADVVAAQQRMHPLPPFSFSTVGQGVAIGRVGVGFWTYPDNRQSLFVIEGPIARHMRNLFVWMVTGVLKLERQFPGSFIWPGRKRVSWHQANHAIEQRRTAPRVQKA